MVIPLLLLAQLVLPSPPSGPIQPPGMICMGECDGGPAVWRTSSDRGKLVVACDMRSDTCSDGRQITTTRSTPVPCETSPGVWEIVPEDTGCYSVRGLESWLESWAENTSYLSYGAELDRSPWQTTNQATVTELEHGWRISGPMDTSRVFQALEPASGMHTFACILRSLDPAPSVRMRIYSGVPAESPIVPIAVTTEWATYSVSRDVPEGDESLSVHLYSGAGTVDVAGCWLTKTSTPGRACWGGEAPVTCAADRHTISTDGWPTEAGEVEIVLHYDQVIGRPERIFDSRSSGDLEHFTLFISSFPGNPLTLSLNQTPIVQSSSLSWEVGKVYRFRVRRTLDGEIELFRDGVRVAAASGPPLSWSPSAVLGSRYDGSQHLVGSISSLRVRSFE